MRDFDPTASEFITSGYLDRSRPGGQLYDIGSVLGGAAGFMLGGPTGAMLGASIGGGYDNAQTASDAAQTQANATNNATALQKQMFDKQISLQEPFRQGGLSAQNRLLTLLGINPNQGSSIGVGGGGLFGGVAGAVGDAINATGAFNNGVKVDPNDPNFGKYAKDFGMSDFQADPGYQWRMDQGNQALQRSAAARGGLLSGSALKAIQDYGQNQASAEYGNAFNRYQTNRANQLNPLQSLMGASQTAANNQGNAASSYGNNVGNLMTNGANAQAASQIAGSNALTGAMNNGLSMYMQNNMMNRLLGSGTQLTNSWNIPMQAGGGY